MIFRLLDDDDDDDDDDNELFDERRLPLFPAGTTVRDLQHRKSLTHRKQDLNLLRT